MARILAYTSPARGHLYPLTPILDELRMRGHAISLRTLASEVELMRGRGFDVEPLDPEVEAGHDDYLARTPQGALKRALRTFARRAEIDVPAMRRAIEETSPEVLLVDLNTWGAQAVAEASGLPWAPGARSRSRSRRRTCRPSVPACLRPGDRSAACVTRFFAHCSPGAMPGRSCLGSTRCDLASVSRRSRARWSCLKAPLWCST
jgi:UDP:flavonoid glycosyltransferase YjiC (YdhE family)